MMSISEHQDDYFVCELRIICLMVIIKAKLAYALVVCRVSPILVETLVETVLPCHQTDHCGTGFLFEFR